MICSSLVTLHTATLFRSSVRRTDVRIFLHRARRSLLLIRKYVPFTSAALQKKSSRRIYYECLPLKQKSHPDRVKSLVLRSAAHGPVYRPSPCFADRRDLAVAYSFAERCEPKSRNTALPVPVLRLALIRFQRIEVVLPGGRIPSVPGSLVRLATLDPSLFSSLIITCKSGRSIWHPYLSRSEVI